ncbi:hypothetical protein B0H10DRAFT_1833363, partial [Mycena sp. CBHHK59/15]
TFPSLMRSLSRSFIMVWNVAGELVSPKNITSGSNSPQFVRNAAGMFESFVGIAKHFGASQSASGGDWVAVRKQAQMVGVATCPNVSQ